VLEVMNAKHLVPIIENTAKFEIQHQYLDSSKARRLLGWAAANTLKTGLEKTIPWYTKLLGDL
jgi:nucleoside-diphosphate-sugar epimerase